MKSCHFRKTEEVKEKKKDERLKMEMEHFFLMSETGKNSTNLKYPHLNFILFLTNLSIEDQCVYINRFYRFLF